MNVFSVCIWSGSSMSLNKTRLDSEARQEIVTITQCLGSHTELKLFYFQTKSKDTYSGYLNCLCNRPETWNWRFKSMIYVIMYSRYGIWQVRSRAILLFDSFEFRVRNSSDILYKNRWQNLWMYGAKTGTASSLFTPVTWTGRVFAPLGKASRHLHHTERLE